MPGSRSAPPAEVLDLFAVPPAVEALPGGSGSSVRAGDLVLSPGRDAETAVWLNPVLARLAVQLDEAPTRRERDVRIAMPVPARDGSWVVQGWGASRYEPGTVACRDLEVTLAAGRVLHAALDVRLRTRPPELDLRRDRWAVAERAAFETDDGGLGADQLVHADLAGNVLLDAAGAPVVIDVSPAWRPVRWAEAVCVLDSVLWLGADPIHLERWRTGLDRAAMLRAIDFRRRSDRPARPEVYDAVLAQLDVPST